MEPTAPFNADALLAEAATITMEAMRVVSGMLQIEQRVATAAAAWLPETGRLPASLAEAAQTGQAIDDAAAAIAQAMPRVDALARALDGLSRSLRRIIALKQRIEAGWPRPRAADDRPAMLRRQVARGVTSMIRHAADGDTAERLFDDLYERLDDPALADDLQSLPVEEIVRRICRDLGLVATALQPLAAQPPYASPAPARPARESGNRSRPPPPPRHGRT